MNRLQVIVWRFGGVEFDQTAGKLRVNGQPVPIDRNCAALLATLLEDAGSEVGKEQLLQAGWPNRIVHDNSLAKAIGRLRVALGDEGAALRAVYGHGYRLEVAPKRKVIRTPASKTRLKPKIGDDLNERAPVLGRRALLAVAGALVIIAGAIFAFASIQGEAPASAEEEFRTTPPIQADATDSIGRILWVDDHPQNNIYEKRLFETRRIAVHNVTSSADALRLLSINDYELVISDLGRGEDRLAGLRLAEAIHQRGIDTPVVIYTIRPEDAEAREGQRNFVAESGADGLAVTPQEIRSIVLGMFGDPAPRSTD